MKKPWDHTKFKTYFQDLKNMKLNLVEHAVCNSYVCHIRAKGFSDSNFISRG